MPARCVAVSLLLPVLTAQEARDVTLPKLLRLGPLPDAPVLSVGAAGPDLGALPAGQRDVVLRIDGHAPAHRVEAALQALRERGVATVHLAATLPQGVPGALALALPEVAEPPATLTLRAHRERTGVPEASAVPVLRRLAAGWQHDGKQAFVLDLAVPADAPWEQVAPLLAAAAAAGVPSLCLRTTAGGPAVREGSLALDLAGAVPAWVPALALPDAKPTVQEVPFGCPRRAKAEAQTRRGGGAGGRFGARAGMQRNGAAAKDDWLTRQQQADGALHTDAGAPDLEGMALWSLCRLADGTTLDAGFRHELLQRCIGWLLANQRDDGSFEDLAPGSVQRHAQIAYALAEAYGLSPSGDLLRGAVDDALRWLARRREQDGGWSGIPGTKSDPVVTAWAAAALASASFFGFDVPKPAEVVAWYDTNGSEEPRAAAAELFSRFFAGQDPRTTPRMAALADRVLAAADPADPHTAFWATHALYQCGGRQWAQWSKSVHTAIATNQSREEASYGSWAPAGGLSRLATTTLNILSLQAYYRYSRLVR